MPISEILLINNEFGSTKINTERNKADELKILQYNLPFASDQILEYCVEFLQNSHKHEEPYTVRDGINIVRYYVKTRELNGKKKETLHKKEFEAAIVPVLEKAALKYLPGKYEKFIKDQEESISHSAYDDYDDGF